jgi:hypothetical protein
MGSHDVAYLQYVNDKFRLAPRVHLKGPRLQAASHNAASEGEEEDSNGY